jgi:hypothetical protein
MDLLCLAKGARYAIAINHSKNNVNQMKITILRSDDAYSAGACNSNLHKDNNRYNLLLRH